MSEVTVVGRSSSHFTRLVRMVAHEVDVPVVLRPVLDLSTLDASAYAGNPALKIPILVDEQGPLFGTENICRDLVARSGRAGLVTLRGDVRVRDVANAEELVAGAMSTEVSVIMTKASGAAPPPKALRSIENSLAFLDERLDAIVAALPAARATSFLEIALFCVLRHLPFREIMDVSRWTRLAAFASELGARPSASATEYRFD